jgi:hypothetical protein
MHRLELIEGGCPWTVLIQTHLLHPGPTPEQWAEMTDEDAAGYEPWYPDSPEDVHTLAPCNDPVQPGGHYGLCSYHEGAMKIPDDEFEAISEAHDGRAFS